MLEGLSAIICGSIRTFCVVCKQGKICAPSTWDVKTFFFSIKGFGVSMAMFSIDPSRVGINMSSCGQGTIPPEVANNAFISAYAFEHIATPTHALPLCQ